ncbi:hypothetical protein IWQ61_001348 [Dispira simplex]|nr:hypothetical protein IWQ61_001348 [Dispira simplex]
MATKRKIGSDFLCKLRYLNTLPPLPFPPKLIHVDTSNYHQTLTRYQYTTLSQRQSYPLYVDFDLGMPLDWVLLGAFDQSTSEPSASLYEVDPADQLLLTSPPALDGQGNRPRSSSNVTWLRRTEYISSEMTRSVSRPSSLAKANGPDTKTPPPPDLSRTGQIGTIEQSFAQAARHEQQDLETWKHPTKPQVHAVETLPVLPNNLGWDQSFTYCIFDSAPTSTSIPTTFQTDHSLLRPVPSATNPQDYYIASYIPSDEGMDRIKKRRVMREPSNEVPPTEPLQFQHARDYTCDKQVYGHLAQLVFTLIPGEGALYTPVTSRLQLRRKRQFPKRTSAFPNIRSMNISEETAIPDKLHLWMDEPSASVQ